jgi:hypothetical protein
MFVLCGLSFVGGESKGEREGNTLNIAILGNSTLNYCKTFLDYTLLGIFSLLLMAFLPTEL